MSEDRHGRHRLLPQIGDTGQARIEASRALVIGLGGLGSPATMYLAAAGVGHLVISDFDRIERSNLHRQLLYRDADVGADKAEAALAALRTLNPEIHVEARNYALDDEDLDAEIEAADAVLDCSDNAETRFALNAACWRLRTPLVSGAAVRGDGQVSVFDGRDAASPCYRCLYDDVAGAEDEPCSRVGVFAPLLGMVGAVQAAEALKLLAAPASGTDSLVGRVLVVDAFYMQWRELRLAKRPGCPVCATAAG